MNVNEYPSKTGVLRPVTRAERNARRHKPRTYEEKELDEFGQPKVHTLITGLEEHQYD